MINYLINAANKIQIKELGLIIGHQQNLIKKTIKEKVTYIYQEEQLGTGHAIKIAKEFYTTVDKIKELNGLENERIRKGDKLLLIKEVEGVM